MNDKQTPEVKPEVKPPMYNPKEMMAGIPQHNPLPNIIRDILRANGVWAEIEPYMLPPGVEGSKHFDHHGVVVALRQRMDAKTIERFNGRAIYTTFYRVAGQIGFRLQHGRITGLLEKKPDDKSPSPNDDDEPDVE